MEKLLSEDERIKKAEEIYYRRKTGDNVNFRTSDNNDIKKARPIKKMLDIIMFCLIVYTIIYSVQNRNYIFTQEFIADVNNIFAVDLKQKIGDIGNYINSKYNSSQGEQTVEENLQQNTTSQTTETETNTEQNTQYIEATLSISEDISSYNQMRIDADEISSTYGMIKPIEGEITSEFGVRSLTNITVSGYHTGLDVAGNTGDTIVAAMSGTVKEVADYGAYGKHVRIVNGDVETMYAHCRKICVEVGDEINQGDKIAEVGSTGNSTGPHLHFEVKKEDRYIDPEYILDY